MPLVVVRQPRDADFLTCGGQCPLTLAHAQDAFIVSDRPPRAADFFEQAQNSIKNRAS